MVDQNDFNLQSAYQRLDVLDTQRAEAVLELQRAKASADYEAAGEAVQRIADVKAQRDNVVNVINDYVASQQPAMGFAPSRDMIHAMTPEEMLATGRGPEIFAKQYGGIDDPDTDPNFQRGKLYAAYLKSQGR